jgi:hypothetical protein
MDHTALISLALIIPSQFAESQSALPGAPVVDDGGARHSAWVASVRARLATTLHRVAWAIEPKEGF